MWKRKLPRLIILVLLALLGAVLAGVAAVFGVAARNDQPGVFLLAGFAVFGVIYLAALWAATRGIAPDRRTRARLLLAFAGTAAVVALFAITIVPPLADPRLPPAPVDGQQFWDLPTGSRIAYVHIAAKGEPRPTPIVFLHGGPGVPDMAGDAAFFGQLAQDGFDVYVYDQVGRGRSSRLSDPRDYTLERDVADLEAIRAVIGAGRMVLIGHSSGGMLAAAYAAAYPERIGKTVLVSPADPAPSVKSASMMGRLDPGQRLGVYALLLQPRALLGYALLQVNPQAAHHFAGDAEMDARFDRVYNRSRSALHCADQPAGPELHGLGFYAHYYQQTATSPPHPDFLPALSALRAPALVIKGRCDYLSWSSAVAYLEAIPTHWLVYFDKAGHNVYQDEPDRVLATVRAFLLDQPLPEPIYAGLAAPAGYEGPR
ncbi:MAG: alpha/beta hydrolase [Thermomicrobiales bacterium]